MVVYFNATLFRRSVTTYRIVASTVYPFSSIRPYMRCERNVSESHHGFAAKVWFGGTSQWTPAHERAMVAWQLLLRHLCYKCCLLCTCSNYVVDEVNFGWFSSMETSHNFLYNIHVARVRWKNFIWGCMQEWVYSLISHHISPVFFGFAIFAGTSSLPWRVCTRGRPQAASPPEPQCWIWKHAAKASAGGTTVSWPRTTTWLMWPFLFVYINHWVQRMLVYNRCMCQGMLLV